MIHAGITIYQYVIAKYIPTSPSSAMSIVISGPVLDDPQLGHLSE